MSKLYMRPQEHCERGSRSPLPSQLSGFFCDTGTCPAHGGVTSGSLGLFDVHRPSPVQGPSGPAAAPPSPVRPRAVRSAVGSAARWRVVSFGRSCEEPTLSEGWSGLAPPHCPPCHVEASAADSSPTVSNSNGFWENSRRQTNLHNP